MLLAASPASTALEPDLYWLTVLSGDRQPTRAGELLEEPFVARLVDDAGNGVMGEEVTFLVRFGSGRLVDETDDESIAVTRRTNARGDVSIRFRPGSGVNVICAHTRRANAPAVFSFSVQTVDVSRCATRAQKFQQQGQPLGLANWLEIG